MRRLLLAVPLLIPLCAQAQTTAANPVEPFSYGVRVGTAKNPLIAALSSVVPSAQAGSTQAAMPVEMFSYGRRVGTQSNPLYVNLGNALDAYLPLTGGQMTGTLTAPLVSARSLNVGTPTSGGSIVLYSGSGYIAPYITSSGSAGLNIGTNSGSDIELKITGNATVSGLSGAGSAYVCVDASGALTRSSTACN